LPKADVKPLSTGPGWGCSCPAFRLGEPTPEQALAALARSVNVTVESKGWSQFVAWTDPESRYIVTLDMANPGGWCKHIIASQVTWVSWHRQLALGADDALAEIKRLEKESKKLRREITKWQKKCTG